MHGIKDMVGYEFRTWKVISQSGIKYKRFSWLCECKECKNQKIFDGNAIRQNNCAYCKCQPKLKINNRQPKVDFTTKKFGKLTVIRWLKGKGWECICECGNIVTRITSELKNVKIASCGCITGPRDLTKYILNNWIVLERNFNSKLNGIIWKCQCKFNGCIKDISTQQLVRRNGTICDCRRPTSESFIGKKFGKLEVLKEEKLPSRKSLETYCLCKCECGNEKLILKYDLFASNTQIKSCGCSKHEKQKSKIKYKKYDSGGYILVYEPNHPFCNKNGRIMEHRYVMEQHLGRYLTEDETVHHKNGKRDQNNIENLELWASNHPPGQRIEDLLKHAHEIIDKYKDFNPIG